MKNAATALVFLSIFSAPLAAGKSTVTGNAFVITLAALGFVVALWQARRKGEKLPISAAAVGLTGFAVLSAFSAVSTESMGATLRQLPAFFSCVFIYLGALIVLRDHSTRTYLLFTLAASGALLGLLGVREYTPIGGDWRVFGTFVSPGYFGGFLAVIIPLTLGVYLSANTGWLIAAAGGAVILETASLMLTGTRFAIAAALLGTLVCIGPAVLLKALDRKQILRLLMLTVLIAPVAAGASKPLNTRVTEGTAQAHSGNFRVVTWKGTARMTADNPILGTGPGTFEIAFPRYTLAGYTRVAHQGYLQAAAECGIPAALFLLFALGMGFITPALAVRRRVISDQSSVISSDKPISCHPEPSDYVISSDSEKSALNQTSIQSRSFDSASSAQDGTVTTDHLSLITDHSLSVLLLLASLSAMSAFLARNMLDSDLYNLGIAVPFWAVTALAFKIAEPKVRSIKLPGWLYSTAAVIAGAVIIFQLMFSAADIQMRQALALQDGGQISEAIAKANNAILLNHWNADYYFRLAWLHTADPRTVFDAASYMKQAIKLEPTRAKYRYNLGQILQMAGQTKEALNAYREACKIDPHSPTPLLALAFAYQRMGDSNKALAEFKKLIDLENSPYAALTGVPELVEPAYAFAHFAVGKSLASKDPEGAIQEYLKVIERLDARDKNSLYVQAMIAGGALDSQDEHRMLQLRKDTYAAIGDAYITLGDQKMEAKYRELEEKIREKLEE